MLAALDALSAFLPRPIPLEEATTLLPMLGFPIDGVEAKEGTHVLDVDITANRGDVMSHRGVARELAARLGAALVDPRPEPLTEGAALREVRLESPLCPVYATAILTLPAASGTPSEALRFLGLLGAGGKQLAAVDASNELLQRYGHPTHAFDSDKLQGAISIRMARSGEKLVTLDGIERTLTDQDLVIADEVGPVALAGVMGGEGSKVTEGTTRVLLESAWFDPRTVRLMARRHGLHTDASHRFGRGADPAMPTVARDLLAGRLMAWASATLEGAWTVGAGPVARPAVEASWSLIDRCAGERVDRDEATALLVRLGCEVAMAEQGLRVIPPSWRHDLAIPEDVAEEILRLRGYDRLRTALPPLDADPEPLDPRWVQRQTVARRLAQLGFCQTVTFGFVDQAESQGWSRYCPDPKQRALGNPLGQEFSIMRGTLLRSLRDVAERNLANGAKDVRLFEIAPVFKWDDDSKSLEEKMTLGLCWAGKTGGEEPFSGVHDIASDEGKAWLIGVLKDLGVPDSVLEEFGPWQMVGWKDDTSEEQREEGEWKYSRDRLGWHFEIPMESLPLPEERIIPGYRPFSRHPAVERDLSLLVDQAQRHDHLVQALRKALPGELQSVGCVDVFRHRSLPAGKQAWLMRFRFQADRTLQGEEVEGWMKTALAAAEGCGAQLRS